MTNIRLNEDELLRYELPTWAEFVNIGWLQGLIAMWLARKVKRKYRRYIMRKDIGL